MKYTTNADERHCGSLLPASAPDTSDPQSTIQSPERDMSRCVPGAFRAAATAKYDTSIFGFDHLGPVITGPRLGTSPVTAVLVSANIIGRTIDALSARRHVQIKASSCEAVQRGARLLHEELGWLCALGTTLLLEGLLTLALFKKLPFDFNQFLVYA